MSRRSGYKLLFAIVAAVTVAKLAVLFTGADYDGDAYAHAMAGRRMLLDPGDVTVHWVWLPLLHAIYAAATVAGSGLPAIRTLNIILSSASPLLLAWLLREHLRRSDPEDVDNSLPWLAGAILAVDPLGIWLGVTGQTEPLFQILLLGAFIAMERRAFAIAGSLFAAAVLTRYEAWPLLPVIAWLSLRERPRRVAPHLTWALPGLAIAAWCLFHYRATGEPLQFLRLNREFARGYLAGMGYAWGREPNLLLMGLTYVVIVPLLHMLGPVHLVSLLALRRGSRSLPRGFFVLGIALLGIITLGFLRGTHLGLPRHAVVIAPFYAALAALGVSIVAERIASRWKGVTRERALSVAALGALALVVAVRTAPRVVSLWRATRDAFVVEAAAAKALRELAMPGETIFCDDGKIEVMTQLGPERFIRWQVPDVAPMHVADMARRGGTLVVSAPPRAAHLPGGSVIWRGGDLAILRFVAPP